MKLDSRTLTGRIMAIAVWSFAVAALVAGQTATTKKAASTAPAATQKKPAAPPRVSVGTAAKPLMAEQVFTNVKVLKGIPATEFMATMGFFSASMVETCTYCHVDESGGSWPHYADDGNPLKNTARQMILMTNNINKSYFAGQQVVTCFTCHHGAEQPGDIPMLALQYGTPPVVDPDQIVAQDPDSPKPEQILDKYIAAIGGAQRLSTLTSYTASGKYAGYSAILTGTVDLYAKAPNQRSMVFHTLSGDITTTTDGREAWSAGPEDTTPLGVVALSGAELEGLKADAQMAFPMQIKTTLTKWRTGAPGEINGKDVQVVQGSTAKGEPVKFYFDPKTGYLIREIRYIPTIVGRNPYQVDFADYRDVSGIKMPFHMVITWTDGRHTMDFTDIKLNVPIDPAAFHQPPAPKPLPSGR